MNALFFLRFIFSQAFGNIFFPWEDSRRKRQTLHAYTQGDSYRAEGNSGSLLRSSGVFIFWSNHRGIGNCTFMTKACLCCRMCSSEVWLSRDTALLYSPAIESVFLSVTEALEWVCFLMSQYSRTTPWITWEWRVLFIQMSPPVPSCTLSVLPHFIWFTKTQKSTNLFLCRQLKELATNTTCLYLRPFHAHTPQKHVYLQNSWENPFHWGASPHPALHQSQPKWWDVDTGGVLALLGGTPKPLSKWKNTTAELSWDRRPLL